MSQNALDIAQKLVRFPSVTPLDVGAQDYLKSLLRPLGFEIFDLPFEGNGGTYRVENFFARRGKTGPHFCYCGHTDVVPAGDENAWSVPPFAGEVLGERLIGRGVSDMKGNIAAFIAALDAYLTSTPSFNGSVSVLITGDEEKESVNGVAPALIWMQENGHLPDVCLVGEPSSPELVGQEMKIGRRGSLTGVLKVTGKQGHVAHPHRADNPLPRVVKMLDNLSSCVFDKGSAFFPPTNLEITTIDVGNTAHNVIPASVTAAFNLRFSDRWTEEALEGKILSLLDAVGGTYEIKFTRGASPFLTHPGEWTSLVSDCVEHVTGLKPAQTTNGGTSDARFIAPYCPVVEFGMVNKSIHQVDEFCTLEELDLCEKTYLEILNRYFA